MEALPSAATASSSPHKGSSSPSSPATPMCVFLLVASEAFVFHVFTLPVLWHQAITSGVLAGCSDVIAQKISGVKKLQLRRLLLIMVCYSVYFHCIHFSVVGLLFFFCLLFDYDNLG